MSESQLEGHSLSETQLEGHNLSEFQLEGHSLSETQFLRQSLFLRLAIYMHNFYIASIMLTEYSQNIVLILVTKM